MARYPSKIGKMSKVRIHKIVTFSPRGERRSRGLFWVKARFSEKMRALRRFSSKNRLYQKLRCMTLLVIQWRLKSSGQELRIFKRFLRVKNVW